MKKNLKKKVKKISKIHIAICVFFIELKVIMIYNLDNKYEVE